MIVAHALGAPVELPLSLATFLIGASAVLVFSFFTLGRLWPSSRFEGGGAGRALPRPVQQVFAVALPVARALVLAAFIAVGYAAVVGRDIIDGNIAPRAVYVVFWVGVTVVSFLLGDVWRALSPFDTLCAVGQWIRLRLGAPAAVPNPYPAEWGSWPAAVLLFAFVWLELVVPDSAHPSRVGLAMGLYTVAMLTGAAIWGRGWLRGGDAFAAYFGLLAQAAPFCRDGDGRLCVRPPLSGLARLRPAPGQAAVVYVALGSTGFDGLTRTTFWVDLTGEQGTAARLLTGAVGLGWMVLVAAVLYVGAVRLAGRLIGRDSDEMVGWFLPSLIPIAFAYAIAHYFALLVFEGQTAVVLASDPLGRGWDVFGTAGWTVNLTFVTGGQIAYIQVATIVAGHVAAVVLAHDRATARLDAPSVARSQYPLMGAMVAYTVGGLALLFGR